MVWWNDDNAHFKKYSVIKLTMKSSVTRKIIVHSGTKPKTLDCVIQSLNYKSKAAPNFNASYPQATKLADDKKCFVHLTLSIAYLQKCTGQILLSVCWYKLACLNSEMMDASQNYIKPNLKHGLPLISYFIGSNPWTRGSKIHCNQCWVGFVYSYEVHLNFHCVCDNITLQMLWPFRTCPMWTLMCWADACSTYSWTRIHSMLICRWMQQ